MKRLADGWQRQRGDIFGFGEHEETDLSISSMDEEKLKSAPINNLHAERSVGSVNYGLKIRGAKNLKTVSFSHVIGKSYGLTEGKEVGKKFREMERQKVFPAIVEAWDLKQEQLKKEGLGEKERQNISIDQRRNADLVKLKALGGPFSSSDEVRAFINSELREEKKVDRLYLEVRYARDSCVSFPKNSDIFRLKKSYKKLDVKTFSDNLIIFLDKISFRKDMDWNDFEKALSDL